jgi:biopolymer transport protein ExbB/TolQ
VTPLLGLLGTVSGMIVTFQTIQARSASLSAVTPGDLAAGIWQALLATTAGLIVAIPTFVAYNYCVSQVNAFVRDMERSATELVNFLCHMSESRLAQLDNEELSDFSNP